MDTSWVMGLTNGLKWNSGLSGEINGKKIFFRISDPAKEKHGMYPPTGELEKARRMLRNLRVKTFTSIIEYKIIGLSEKRCRQQTFFMKQRNADSPGEPIEITISDYYAKYRIYQLTVSHNYPCLDVGKPKRPIFIPLELCELISLQCYTKSLSNLQRAKLVEQSRQKPEDRMNSLMHEMKRTNSAADSLINSTGITISNSFIQLEG
ncbi:protein argonaute 4A-like [Bidens hawaiensis]|uniref:protein argonaute 4A-like n=1 Tax=Bidens hawaiensis TaxID=980011 RepID=UPI00404AB198